MTWEEFCAANIPAPATLSVEAYTGSGPYGDTFAAPVDVSPCVVEDTRRLVRVQTTDAAGSEQVSSTTVYAPIATVAPPGSRVVLSSGRETRVLASSRIEASGWDLPEHLAISLE